MTTFSLRCTPMIAMVALVASSGGAHAQAPTLTRPGSVAVPVTLSERAKPLTAKDPTPAAPTVTGDDVLHIEGLRGPLRIEQAAILRDLYAKTPKSNTDERADYLFRLGELFAQEERYYRLKAAELDIAAAAATAEAKAKARRDSALALAKSKASLQEAVASYSQLTSEEAFRNYPMMDKALFTYGYALQHGGYEREARIVFEKLLRNYPGSKYAPDAHLAFADYFFEAHQLADAEASYRKVLRYPNASIYPYALYKMGWISLNLSRYQDALDSFFKVVELTKRSKSQVLHRAASNDFVRAYAEIGKVESALAAFRRVDRDAALTMLASLGDRYLEQGKSEKAIYTFRELIQTSPKSSDVCLWQYHVSHAMLTAPAAGSDDRVREIEKLVQLWEVLRDRSSFPKAAAEECHDNAAAMSGELARAFHSEAVRTKSLPRFALAERLYQAYLRAFPDAADFADTQYYYAELLWVRAENEAEPTTRAQRFERAALAFTDVVQAKKTTPAVQKTAAYAAVLSWNQALSLGTAIAKEEPVVDDAAYDKLPEKTPLTDQEQKMVAAFDLYLGAVKEASDDQRIGLVFLKADTYRRHNDFDRAIPLFQEVLRHREHETAEVAATLLLDSLNRMHRYEDMLALAGELEADQAFIGDKPKLRGNLALLRVTHERKQAERAEAEGKRTGDLSLFVTCADLYIKIFNRDPNVKDADVLLYNAGVCFEEGKSLGAALAMFGKLADLYPASPYAERAILCERSRAF
jgi:cellulose synthase operon protein C